MAIRTSGSGEVKGLADFRRALKALEGDYPKQLGQINQDVGELVVDQAEHHAHDRGGPYLAALRLGGLKASKAQTAARIVLDGVRAPMIFGAEFGAKRWPQFDRWTGSGDDAGYALWPAVREKQDEAGEMYLDALDELSRKAFPD